MANLRKPFDVRYYPAQEARAASGGYSQCGYVIVGYSADTVVNCRSTFPLPPVFNKDGTVYWPSVVVCDIVRTPIYQYQCTYLPYQPAQEASPARVEKTPRIGWDAGASSVVGRTDDCQLEFSVDPATGVFIGLAGEGDVTDTTQYRYAFYLRQVNYQNVCTVVVDGAQCTAPTPYTTDTVFKIRRVGTKVEFSVDGAVVHADTGSPEERLLARTTVYASGDAVPEIDSCCAALGGGGGA